jgi:N6-adenosine-specific RNA methylase IME4
MKAVKISKRSLKFSELAPIQILSLPLRLDTTAAAALPVWPAASQLAIAYHLCLRRRAFPLIRSVTLSKYAGRPGERL